MATTAEPEVMKTVKLPADLWLEIETQIAAQDSDFSKICRNALRQYINRLTDRQTRKRKAA